MMSDLAFDQIEEKLADHGYRGIFAVNRHGVVTLEGGLPATDEALEALEDAFAPEVELAETNLGEEAIAT
jgi:hypothetical protein